MTKVTLHFDLLRPLSDEDYTNIGAIHSVYGMARVASNASGDKLTVDYDASRLTPKDVHAVLARFGMPLKTPVLA
jgi:hypothetical protein